MKILARVGNGYIAQVSHVELEKVLDRYYGKLQQLEPQEEINLGQGYDFRSDIKQVCEKMIEAEKSFGQARQTLYNFAQAMTMMNEELKKPDKK